MSYNDSYTDVEENSSQAETLQENIADETVSEPTTREISTETSEVATIDELSGSVTDMIPETESSQEETQAAEQATETPLEPPKVTETVKSSETKCYLAMEKLWKKQAGLIAEMRYFMNLSEIKGRFALGKLLRTYLISLEIENSLVYANMLRITNWKELQGQCVREDYELPGALTRLLRIENEIEESKELSLDASDRRVISKVHEQRTKLLNDCLNSKEQQDRVIIRYFVCQYCGEISNTPPEENMTRCKICSQERFTREVF